MLQAGSMKHSGDLPLPCVKVLCPVPEDTKQALTPGWEAGHTDVPFLDVTKWRFSDLRQSCKSIKVRFKAGIVSINLKLDSRENSINSNPF